MLPEAPNSKKTFRFSGEVRFHFWGGKKDGSKVRESLNRLVQRGRLGNVSLVPTHLAITQEPTLQLQVILLFFLYLFNEYNL